MAPANISLQSERSSIKSLLLSLSLLLLFLWAGLFRSFIQLLSLAFSTCAVDLLFAHFNFPKSLLQATFFESRKIVITGPSFGFSRSFRNGKQSIYYLGRGEQQKTNESATVICDHHAVKGWKGLFRSSFSSSFFFLLSFVHNNSNFAVLVLL